MLCFIFVERIVYFRWSGQAASDAGHILRRVIAIDKDARDLIPSIPLLDSTGRRKQMTPVADIQTVLRVIVQLPCRGLPCYYHLTTGWLPAAYHLITA